MTSLTARSIAVLVGIGGDALMNGHASCHPERRKVRS
jgi:hypothetical protein